MWSKAFWADCAERAIRTFAQTGVALLGTDLAGWTNLDWPQIGTITGIATLVSVLNYIAAHPLQAVPAGEVYDVEVQEHHDPSVVVNVNSEDKESVVEAIKDETTGLTKGYKMGYQTKVAAHSVRRGGVED